MPTIAFKLSELEKELANDIVESFAELNGLNKSEALIRILREYKTSQQERGDYVPPNVNQVLEGIPCKYLQFIANDFLCYEQAHKKKQPTVLNGTPEEVKITCQACLQGKRDLEIARSKKLQEKEYIRRLRTFAKQLIRITEKGIVNDVFFCLCETLDNQLGFSRDNETMICPLEDQEVVYIEETCKNRIDPKTGESPCQYLTSMQNIVRIDQGFWEKRGDDLEVDLLEDIGIEDRDFDKRPTRKTVEPEFEIQGEKEE